MECREVRERLPEYMAGMLPTESAEKIKQHIENCSRCSTEASALLEPVVALSDRDGTGNTDADRTNTQFKKVLKRTRNAFYFRVILAAAGVALLFWLVLGPPLGLGTFSPFTHARASRVLMDVVQFSQPDKVNSWGNRLADLRTFSEQLTNSARPVIGRGMGEQWEITANLSFFTGKITGPQFLGSKFIHPDLPQDKELGRIWSPSTQRQRLQKNSGNTVATVDFSLSRAISLEETVERVKDCDVEIGWLALEAGIEKLQPRNMSFDGQQVLQWGIPGKLSKPGAFDYAVLGKERAAVQAYKTAVLEELKWLEENKSLMVPDGGLLRNNGIDTGIGEKAAYILKNGFKVYGLRVTGPSEELLKASDRLEPRMMNVAHMDFWNW